MILNDTTLFEKLKGFAGDVENAKISIGLLTAEGIDKVFYNGKEIYREVPNYIYEIGSVTKTFTAALLCKEVEMNKMSFEDRVSRYIKGLPKEYYCPTLLQIVTHTAGYGNELNAFTEEGERLIDEKIAASWSGDGERDNINRLLDENDLIEFVKGEKLEANEYKWKYSNLGYSLLGYLIGKTENQGFGEVLQDFIKNDLKLDNTYTDRPTLGALEGCTRSGESGGNWIWESSSMKGAGCIYSTIDDMLKYVSLYQAEAKSYLNMTHNKAYADIEISNQKMGLGWIKNGDITWHNGGTGCFRSYVAFREDKRGAVVVLSNYAGKSKDKVFDNIGQYLIEQI